MEARRNLDRFHGLYQYLYLIVVAVVENSNARPVDS